VNLADLADSAAGASTADFSNYGWGRAGADVTGVTLITQAGEKIPARVQRTEGPIGHGIDRADSRPVVLQ
jgi:hypothetical protein